MYTIVVKIYDPHGWVVASEFLNHNDSYLGVQYVSSKNINENLYDTIVVPSEEFTPKGVSEGIVYWFNNAYKDKKNILIFTESTEEENKELIHTMRELNIEKAGFPAENICIIICNSFMEYYRNNLTEKVLDKE